MSGDFWLGVAVIPALAAVAGAGILIRWFFVHRIQRLNPDSNVHHRAAFAARVFAGCRVYHWTTRRLGVALTLGAHWPTQDRAEGVLLDEFAPVREETR